MDFLGLLETSAGVLTDSGGVQEESTYLRVPCFTLRDNTERPVTITEGTNRLLGLNPAGSLRSRNSCPLTARPVHLPPDGMVGRQAGSWMYFAKRSRPEPMSDLRSNWPLRRARSHPPLQRLSTRVHAFRQLGVLRGTAVAGRHAWRNARGRARRRWVATHPIALRSGELAAALGHREVTAALEAMEACLPSVARAMTRVDQWNAAERAPLIAAAEKILVHEFDLLGSGPVALGNASTGSGTSNPGAAGRSITSPRSSSPTQITRTSRSLGSFRARNTCRCWRSPTGSPATPVTWTRSAPS